MSIDCNICGDPLPHERCDPAKAGDGHIKGPYVETYATQLADVPENMPVLREIIARNAKYEADAFGATERMEKALRAIFEGTQNQGPLTGMSWQEVERLCKEGLG